MRKRIALLTAIVVGAIALSTTAPAFATVTPSYSLTTSNPSVGARESFAVDATYPAQGCSMAVFAGDTLGSSGLPCAYVQFFDDVPRSVLLGRGSDAGSITLRFYSAAAAEELQNLVEGIDPLGVSYEASVTLEYEATPADRVGWMTASGDDLESGIFVSLGDLLPGAPFSIDLFAGAGTERVESLENGAVSQNGQVFESAKLFRFANRANGWYTLRVSTTSNDGQLVDFDTSFQVVNDSVKNSGSVFEFGVSPSGFADSTSSLATVGVVSGTRSAALADFSFLDSSASAAKYSHVDQVVSGVSLLTVDDSSGTGLGWAVTEQVSNVEWVSAGGAVPGVVLTPADYSIASVGAVSTNAGQAWNSSAAVAGALNSPVTVLTAEVGAGSGRYTVPVNFALRLPGQSRVGTYTATLTTTMSVAP